MKDVFMNQLTRNLLCVAFLVFSSTPQVFCEAQSRPQANTNGVVFREPFTLKLHVDKEHYYEEKFPKIPYVHGGDIYLFKGDSFGVDLDITNGVIRGIAYQADTNKAAMILEFTQMKIDDDGKANMLLVIRNKSNQKLFFDALMTVPDSKKIRKTSILPVSPGLTNYETWPHPIVQLVLCNIRLKEQVDTQQDKNLANQTKTGQSETNRNSSTNHPSP